jgi:DNA-binding NarL/FixJ family response regulator
MNVLIIEDHPITALGLQILLNKHFNPIKVDIAFDGASAISFLKKESCDLVVLDIILPKTDTQSLTHKIRRLHEKTKVLVYSSCNEKIYAGKYLGAGANGFVSKSALDEDFILGVRTIMSGNLFIPKDAIYADNNSLHLTSKNVFSSLSKRELEVLNHLLNGLNQKEISETMNLQPSTIATQKARIFTKLDTDNMVDLYHLANQYGLFTNLAQEN